MNVKRYQTAAGPVIEWLRFFERDVACTCGAEQFESTPHAPDCEGGTYCDEIPTRLPAKYEVCSTCHGNGTHVNPSIDGNGLTAEDFDEDPTFREDYFAGVYDVTCGRCNGKRVCIEVDTDKLKRDNPPLLDEWYEALDDEWRYQQQVAAERRMGA